jgi:TolB-like protein/Tfp pilus assembly protein PilF
MLGLVRFSAFEVDLSSRELRKNGLRINLRDKSFQVLAALLEHAGELVTREELRQRLWPGDVFVDFDNNLNTAIGRLREALCDSAEHPHFIETLPKRGYRFVARVTEAPRTAQRVSSPATRLLVLPFVNLSGDPAQEYFSDAMTDEIITQLAALAPKQLGVIARTTAMHYKGSQKDVAQIARELAVDYVVEGGIHRADHHIRLNAQLIRANDQTHQWAQRYDGELHEVFTMQSGVAHGIAAHIGIAPAASEARDGSGGFGRPRKPTNDLTAYNLFLQGRHHLYKGAFTILAKAREHLEAAVARDPEFALAYDSLGELHWVLGFYGLMRPKEACSIGLCHALRALEIDNSLAETHALVGQFRKQVDFNWVEAEREMRRALELNPTSPVVVYRHAASYLLPQGRLAEAAAGLERVLEYDPLDLNVRTWLGVLHWIAGRHVVAAEQLHQALEIDANYPLAVHILGLNRLTERRFDEALALLRRSVELHLGSPMVLGWLGLALAQSGNRSEALSLLQKLHAMAERTYVPATSFAWTHLGLGHIDETFVWLDRAVEERDHMMTPIKTYPFFDPIRGDPRFTALVRKMNLDSG